VLEGDPHPYSAPSASERLFQGEILSNVVERSVKCTSTAGSAAEFGLVEITHPHAVLLTQDCDLLQDSNARQNPDLDSAKRKNSLVPNLVLVVASEFEKTKGRFNGSEISKRVRQNKEERFQFLSAVPISLDGLKLGVPALVLDFKRFFTYPTEEFLQAVKRGEIQRRSRLLTPYAEHLSSRFGYFILRIGLPLDHHDMPAS